MQDLPSPAPLDPELGGKLIDAAGTDAFAPAMLGAAQRFAPVEEVFAYRIADGGAPQVLAWSSSLQADSERAEQYARRFFRHDPATRMRTHAPVGTGFAGRVAATDIAPHDYRAICFERPRFVDKLCFGWRGRDDTLVISFYRRRGSGVDAGQRLATLADIGLSALARSIQPPPERQAPLEERIEARMARAFPMLTQRERQVCARSLAGWTAERIGEALGIGTSTVMTYRQRAYARLDISGVEGFLPGLLD